MFFLSDWNKYSEISKVAVLLANEYMYHLRPEEFVQAILVFIFAL